jgi:hypothetical protein
MVVSSIGNGDTFKNCILRHVLFDISKTPENVTFEQCWIEDIVFPGGLTFGPDGTRICGMKRIPNGENQSG